LCPSFGYVIRRASVNSPKQLTQEKVPSNSAFSCGGRAWHQQGFDPSDPEKVDFVGGFRDIQITLFPF
jgi:hypothetical protein